MLATISASALLVAVIIIGIIIYLAINFMVATYGRDRGYPFFPLFVASWFLGFPLVLLVITIAAGRKAQE